MTEGAQIIIPITSPRRVFQGHSDTILSAAIFSDGRWMVTNSFDKTLRLWDLMYGCMWKEMVEHRERVRAVAVSRNGKLIASGDDGGELIAWDGDTGAPITQIKGHSRPIFSLDFSPDNTVLATVSLGGTIKLWSTDTWDIQRNPIQVGCSIYCVRFSPSGKYFAVATDKYIQIWNASGSECIAKFRPERVPYLAWNTSLAWTPDGTRLFSLGSLSDPTIREWDTSVGIDR